MLLEAGLGSTDAVYIMRVEAVGFTIFCTTFGEGMATAPEASAAFMLNPVEYGWYFLFGSNLDKTPQYVILSSFYKKGGATVVLLYLIYTAPRSRKPLKSAFHWKDAYLRYVTCYVHVWLSAWRPHVTKNIRMISNPANRSHLVRDQTKPLPPCCRINSSCS